MGKHSLDTPGRKRKDPATKGAAILNLVSGVLNVVTATVRLIAVMLHVGLENLFIVQRQFKGELCCRVLG